MNTEHYQTKICTQIENELIYRFHAEAKYFSLFSFIDLIYHEYCRITLPQSTKMLKKRQETTQSQ